jgi:hypothetical protein
MFEQLGSNLNDGEYFCFGYESVNSTLANKIRQANSEIYVLVLTTISFQSSEVAQQASDLIYKVFHVPN